MSRMFAFWECRWFELQLSWRCWRKIWSRVRRVWATDDISTVEGRSRH